MHDVTLLDNAPRTLQLHPGTLALEGRPMTQAPPASHVQPPAISGLLGCPLTPFTADNQLDIDTFERLVDFMVRHGNDAIVVAMHLGESLNLTVEERKALAEAAVRASAGRAPTYVHASMPGTDAAIDLARHGDSVGAAGSCVITPYHWQPSHDALVRHFVSIAHAMDGQLMAYNFPKRLGVWVTPQIIGEVVEQCDNFVGLKTAELDMEYFTEVCRVGREVRSDFAVFSGTEYALPGIALGAAGTFSVASGIAPRLVRDLLDAALAHDVETALPLQYKFSALWHLLNPGYPARFKAAMQIMGRPVGPARQPAPVLDDDELKTLEADLEAMGITETEPHGW
jgi:4-hydroxy-tetrahydrodipicolinate synthase